MSDVVSLAEAAELLKIKAKRPHQWLRRHLLAVERRTGQVVLERVGEGARRPTYKVNLGRLRVVCPLLFEHPLASALQQSALVGARELKEVRRELTEIREILEEHDGKLGAIANSSRAQRR